MQYLFEKKLKYFFENRARPTKKQAMFHGLLLCRESFLKLAVVQLGVQTVLFKQRVVRAALDDIAVVHN